ncbi:DUF4237 domain-containing protein [Solihabitans fulvus]|uniref:DUF4237 domain-containing protein n=1 Tax=Solihabitans fulvus TaxID=1892852 RepID=A0A5B2WKI3_9PSEU|nr:DUF4237 domain-containing protein [Solihabitans fulvus]
MDNVVGQSQGSTDQPPAGPPSQHGGWHGGGDPETHTGPIAIGQPAAAPAWPAQVPDPGGHVQDIVHASSAAGVLDAPPIARPLLDSAASSAGWGGAQQPSAGSSAFSSGSPGFGGGSFGGAGFGGPGISGPGIGGPGISAGAPASPAPSALGGSQFAPPQPVAQQPSTQQPTNAAPQPTGAKAGQQVGSTPQTGDARAGQSGATQQPAGARGGQAGSAAQSTDPRTGTPRPGDTRTGQPGAAPQPGDSRAAKPGGTPQPAGSQIGQPGAAQQPIDPRTGQPTGTPQPAGPQAGQPGAAPQPAGSQTGQPGDAPQPDEPQTGPLTIAGGPGAGPAVSAGQHPLGQGAVSSVQPTSDAPLYPVAQHQPRPAVHEPEPIALFLVHLFPIGHLPVPTSRPARQLPPPPVELDYAAGLRYPPQDHPESGLVHDKDALLAARSGQFTPPPSPGLRADAPEVVALAEGYDSLAGEHERDWDRRFLVRAADQESGSPAEYAWPPGELFPEGGCEAGEPVVLAAETVLDRFGTPEGRVLADTGTPFGRRSLPPALLDAGYRSYRVLRPLPVWRTLSTDWFGQSGGGVRYRATYPVADLVGLGYLEEVR